MSFKEYSFKFVKLFKYASSLVSSSRDEMSRFVTNVSEDLEEEYQASMLHDNKEFARLMVHEQQVEVSHWRKRGREGKKPRPRIRLVLALVRVRLEYRIDLSSRRDIKT